MATVTLKDIASMVGVSANTVSRALQDKPDIGVQTRQRIREAAAALGYRPNLTARNLVRRKTMTIGIAVNEADNPVRMEFYKHVRQYAAESGYRLVLAELNESAIEDLLASGVDGMIIGFVYGIVSELPLGKLLMDCRLNETPVVLFGMPETNLADYLEINFRDCSARLTSYMIERGRVPTAFMRNDRLDEPRLQGYIEGMTSHGLKERIVIWPIDSNSLSCGRDAMDKYLQEHQRPPEAILTGNDLAAIGIMSALKKHGFRIPQDVAVAGFDNIEIGAYFDPPLTTAGCDIRLFAESAWVMLLSRLDKSVTGPARKQHFAQQLIIRESC